jgi:hypothetical protein
VTNIPGVETFLSFCVHVGRVVKRVRPKTSVYMLLQISSFHFVTMKIFSLFALIVVYYPIPDFSTDFSRVSENIQIPENFRKIISTWKH